MGQVEAADAAYGAALALVTNPAERRLLEERREANRS
jgi:predicted RNA polymerase sigma factor